MLQKNSGKTLKNTFSQNKDPSSKEEKKKFRLRKIEEREAEQEIEEFVDEHNPFRQTEPDAENRFWKTYG